MNVVRLSLTALMLATATYCTHLLDQYEHGSDSTLGHRSKATDQAFDVHRLFINGNTLNKLQTEDKQIVPSEHQVGCAHSLFELDENKKRRVLRKRAVEEIKRKRRGFFEWTGTVVQAPNNPSFTVWQPPVYQLSRPYFIPVWGGPGRIPIYFPPQPILINNPYTRPSSVNNGYLPPKGYLPPDTKATTVGYKENEDDVTMPVINRLQEDDAPIWGTEPIATTAAPVNKPTRRTLRPGQKITHPPLVHRAENSTTSNANNLSPVRPQRLPSNSVESIERPSVGLQTPVSNNRPVGGRQQPSRCVWAIISCCSAGSMDVSYSCFEQLGCPGAFWGDSPCNSDFAKSALELAMKYYNQ